MCIRDRLNIVKDGMLSSGITAKIGALLLKPVFKDIKKRFDYKEYGCLLYTSRCV